MTTSLSIKSPKAIDAMRAAGRLAGEVLDRLCQETSVGMDTYQLDQRAKALMEAGGGESACYHYQVGEEVFPNHICISINDAIVHGIGKPGLLLQRGDKVSLDVVVKLNGFIADNARTFFLGNPPKRRGDLLRVTQQALFTGITEAVEGRRVGDISSAIQTCVESAGFVVVKEFVGHGVGRAMHEPPTVPNFGQANRGVLLEAGMTLAIEPIVLESPSKVVTDPDGWTARASSGALSAHFEHTVLVTASQPLILTKIKK